MRSRYSKRLDDAVEDTPAERTRWSAQIIALADEATYRLALNTGKFDDKRGVERDAPDQLDRVQRTLARLDERQSSAAPSIRAIDAEYAASALARLFDDLEKAQNSIQQAHRTALDVQSRLDAGTPGPIGDLLRTADQESFLATRLLDGIDAAESGLRSGSSTLREAIIFADGVLAQARALRDRHEESDTRDSVNRAIRDARLVLADFWFALVAVVAITAWAIVQVVNRNAQAREYVANANNGAIARSLRNAATRPMRNCSRSSAASTIGSPRSKGPLRTFHDRTTVGAHAYPCSLQAISVVAAPAHLEEWITEVKDAPNDRRQVRDGLIRQRPFGSFVR